MISKFDNKNFLNLLKGSGKFETLGDFNKHEIDDLIEALKEVKELI